MTQKYLIKTKAIFVFLCMIILPLQAEISYNRKIGLLDLASQLSGPSSIGDSSSRYTRGLRQKIPLDTIPYWSSQAYGTEIWGVALADITNDGYPEVITIYEQGYNYIYLNNQGVIESTPSWQSNDWDYHIWPAFGDYDSDGDLDMAVACYEWYGGKTKLYQNDNGTLSSDPAWTASLGGGTRCDWGDVDNDGDLDLAIADVSYYPAVFYNTNGILESSPSWCGTDYFTDFDVAWLDVDNDGDLDLAVGGLNFLEPTLRIYYNDSGTLETIASWKSQITAGVCRGVGLSVWDVDQDGWLDVAVAAGYPDDSQCNRIFKNLQDSLESYPSWFSNDSNVSVCGLFGDLNGDGCLDWAVNNKIFGVVYENLGDSIDTLFTWQSTVSGGFGIDLGDVDQDGVIYREDTIIADGGKRLFYLPIIPIHKLEEITINGDSVPLNDYCCDLKSGWISFKNTISTGSEIIFKYYHSVDLELLLSDESSNKAHLFKNTNIGLVEQYPQHEKIGFSIYPNPILAGVPAELVYSVTRPTIIELDLYDCTGRKIETIFKQKVDPGMWRKKIRTQFLPGIYFLRLKSHYNNIFTKIVIIK